jgi:hypothetical protein
LRKTPILFAENRQKSQKIVTITSAPGSTDFSLHNTYTKTGRNIPNDHKIYQLAVKYSKWPKIHQHFPFKGPNTKIEIFGNENLPSGNPVFDDLSSSTNFIICDAVVIVSVTGKEDPGFESR